MWKWSCSPSGTSANTGSIVGKRAFHQKAPHGEKVHDISAGACTVGKTLIAFFSLAGPSILTHQDHHIAYGKPCPGITYEKNIFPNVTTTFIPSLSLSSFGFHACSMSEGLSPVVHKNVEAELMRARLSRRSSGEVPYPLKYTKAMMDL